MRYPNPAVIIAVVIIGLVLSTVGTLGYAGFIRCPSLKYAMFAGYAVTVIGLALMYFDMRGCMSAADGGSESSDKSKAKEVSAWNRKRRI